MEEVTENFGFYGMCAPGNAGCHVSMETFSVAVFRLQKRSNGSGNKRGEIIARVKGATGNADAVYAKARKLCQQLEGGWTPDKKTFTV
jgi:hypothetical protein